MTLVLALSLLQSIMETCSVVLTFESVDEILWCDHSNETSSAVLCMVLFEVLSINGGHPTCS